MMVRIGVHVVCMICLCFYICCFTTFTMGQLQQQQQQQFVNVYNISFWKSLSLDLHVFDEEFATKALFLPPAEAQQQQQQVIDLILKEGYVQLPTQAESIVNIDAMAALIEKLHSLNIPIAFCFLFDEFWIIFMRLHGTIETILGKDYKRLPDFWAWRVDPKKDEQGWRVHRDKGNHTLYRNGMPKSVSVWIPLSDATTANGCMYVLPADRDPTYADGSELTPHWKEIAPDIRALPIQKGEKWRREREEGVCLM